MNTAAETRAGFGILLVMGSCLSLQLGAALATQLFGPLGPWGVTTLRLVLGAAILLLVVRPAMLRWNFGQWRAVVLFGITMGLMNGFFYAAIARIPLSVAVALEFLGPLVLSAVSSRRLLDLAWVLLAVGGMGLIGWESMTGADSLDPLGVVFALVAGVFWAGYVMASARVGRVVPGTGGLAASMAVSGLFLLPVGGASAIHAFQDVKLLGLAAATALLASVIPYSLELAALRRVPQNVFSILLSLEPAFAALFGWLLLAQHVSGLRILAIALVILASMGTTLSASMAARRHRARGQDRREDEPDPATGEVPAPALLG